jgi:hypothetical protein
MRSIVASLTLVSAAVFASRTAGAQACCAGSSAVTPGRLAPFEDALVGVQAQAGRITGSFIGTRFTPNPAGASEADLEQDVFGSLRFLGRGQASLVVPFVETFRSSGGLSGAGGGIGDVNLAGRWDFRLAGQSLVLPGIAVLAGMTAPTGRPIEAAVEPHAADATGTGAWQVSGGAALEQTYGPWFVGLSGFVSQRTARTVGTVHERLGLQYTGLLAGAYSWPNEAAIALSIALVGETAATVNGLEDPSSARSVTTATLAGLWPFSDRLRLRLGLYVQPPIDGLGRNQPASNGVTLAVLWTKS